jgi:type IV pilus assembly protein PilQ
MNPIGKRMRCLATLAALSCFHTAGWAQSPAAEQAGSLNAVEDLQVSQQAGTTVVKITLKQALPTPPASFSITSPARIAFDLPATANSLGRASQQFNEGDVRSVNIVQVTRLVLNLKKITTYVSRLDGKNLFVTLAAQPPGESVGAPAVSHFAEAQPQSTPQSLRDITFRRGRDGEARITVDLSDPSIGIDIRQQGANLVVDFVKTTLPESLRRRLDVTDFATPVTTINTVAQGENTRMIISPRGLWEHNAYQSDNQFVIEIKKIIENPNKLVQGTRGGYQGEKLSLNFQSVEVRSVLQVIADFTNFNIITSDTVTGNLTLRLKDVPWDQALDIILQARGLDMRKSGNVIWIAPRDELAAKEKSELESKVQIGDLEPLRTETFQINYQKADDVHNFLKNKEQTIISKRGSVIADKRSNKLFVTDTASRLDDVRRVISEIDVAARQVLIEARIVEASDTFSKSIGVRLGVNDFSTNGNQLMGSNARYTIGGTLANTGTNIVPSSSSGSSSGSGSSSSSSALANNQNVNLPANPLGGVTPGAFSFILFNNAKTQFLNLELSALEADGKGKVVSSPRVVTANQIEALIEQGVEIPYQQASSSGATAVSFRKANLSLKVTPQITPDGRVMMALDINKDTPNTQLSTGGNGIAIDTKHIKTDVLIENGGTVVIGGIYTQEVSRTVDRIPVLGDIPYLGFLFRTTGNIDNKTELLVFITPKIVSDSLNLR